MGEVRVGGKGGGGGMGPVNVRAPEWTSPDPTAFA